MRIRLACSVAALAACLAAAPAYSQQLATIPASVGVLDGGAASALNLTDATWSANEAERGDAGYTRVMATGWDLAQINTETASAPLDEGDGRFSLTAIDRGVEPVPTGEAASLAVKPDEVATVTGPISATEGVERRWTDHVPREYSTHPTFWKQAGSIGTELALVGAYFAVQSGKKLFNETTAFHFHKEGWFGKDTTNVGMDKMGHSFNTYLLAEILHMRLHKNTNASAGDALTAGILASGFMALNEISDGIETDSGYSMEDIAMNTAGAVFSVLRNTIPGLKEKVAFKIEIVPDDNIYSAQGQAHYAQQRFMFSLKASGFEALRKTPLRVVDFQVGYWASNFTPEDRAAGTGPKRHLFVGLGLNLGELLFGRSKSTVGRAAYTVLDYFQVPYTSIRYDAAGRFLTS